MADEQFIAEQPALFPPTSGTAERVWNLIGRYGPDVNDLCRAGARLVPGVVFAAAATELLTLETLNLNLTDAFTERRRPGSLAPEDATPISAAPRPEAGSPAVLLACWFDVTALALVRRQVRAACAGRGLAGDDLYPFVLAVHEAMTNPTPSAGAGYGSSSAPAPVAR
jgi:hypothetical protein